MLLNNNGTGEMSLGETLLEDTAGGDNKPGSGNIARGDDVPYNGNFV